MTSFTEDEFPTDGARGAGVGGGCEVSWWGWDLFTVLCCLEAIKAETPDWQARLL